MPWYYNKKVRTYAWASPQWAYAYIDGVGWRKIKTGAADGVTNVHLILTAAQANGKLAHVYVDGSNLIAAAMLV